LYGAEKNLLIISIAASYTDRDEISPPTASNIALRKKYLIVPERLPLKYCGRDNAVEEMIRNGEGPGPA
jgi:hypothetical protein